MLVMLGYKDLEDELICLDFMMLEGGEVWDEIG